MSIESLAPPTRSASRAPVFWMGAGYWWYFAAIGCFFPFIGIHYRQLGLTGQQIGMLGAVAPLATALLAPFWGMIADLYGTHRLILRLALLPVVGVIVLLTWATTFGAILPLIIIQAVLLAPVMPFMDGYGIAISEKYHVSFGKLRLPGTVGFILAVFGVGWWLGDTITPKFFLAYAIGMLLAFFVTFGLPALEINTARPDWYAGMGLLRQPGMIVLLVTTWLVWIGFTTITTFFSIYLSELNGVHLIGVVNVVLASSELPILFYSNKVIERLGLKWMMIIGIAIFGLRFVLYSIVPSAEWVIPIQLLHTFSFTFYLLASVRMAHQLGGRELAATAQSLLASANALGSITGALVGGVLFDWLGVFVLFRLAAVVTLIALIVFVVGMRWVEQTQVSSQ